MTTYNTGNPIGSVDVKDLNDNAQNLDHLVNDQTVTEYPDRFAQPRKSWWGMEQDFYAFLQGSQFELPPLNYVDGTPLTVLRPTQTILRSGQLYRVKLPAAFPVNLTGTWATDQPLLTPMSDAVLRQDLANGSDVALGAALLGRAFQAVDTVAGIRALLKTSPSKYAEVLGYYAPGDGGGGLFYLDAADTTSVDNGGTVIVATDGGRWKLNHNGTVSIKQFGARGNWNGSTGANDTAAFTAAVASGVFRILIPATANSYQLTSPLNVTTGIIFQGEGVVPYTALGGTTGPANTRGKGSWLFFNHTGKGVVINSGNGSGGPEFRNLGTVRPHPTPGAGAFTATVADYDFEVNNTVDVKFIDVCLLNPYKGIYSHGSQTRTWFNRVYGQPLREGIRCEECFDIHRFNDVHFWPYWAQNTNVWTYTKANLDTFAFGRCDGFMLNNVFSIFHKRGMVIYGSASGTANKLTGVNVFLDQGTDGYVVDSSATGHTAMFSNLCLHGDTGIVGANYGMAVYANQVDISISNANISNVNSYGVYVAGTFCNIGIHDVVFLDWGLSSTTLPAINVTQNNSVIWLTGSKRFYSNAGNVASRYASTGNTIRTVIDRGVFSGTTNGSGDVTITFTGNATPNSINLTNLNAASITYAITARSLSQFTVRLFNGTTPLTSTAVSIGWEVCI